MNRLVLSLVVLLMLGGLVNAEKALEIGDRLRRPFRPWFRYEYEIVQPNRPVEPRIGDEFEESKVASITPSLEWDTRDNPLAPDRGVFASASVQYAFPAFLADEHFLPGIDCGREQVGRSGIVAVVVIAVRPD